LPRRELREAREMLSHDRLSRDNREGVLDQPSHVVAGLVLCALERVGAQIKQARYVLRKVAGHSGRPLVLDVGSALGYSL
jgi:hypothetical protein